MNRLFGCVSAGIAIAAAPLLLAPAQAQTADKPEAIVCQLLDNCSDAATVPDKRPVRRGEVRGFSLARPKSAVSADTPAPSASAPRAGAAATQTASRAKPKASAAPHGQYDLRVSFMTGSADVNPMSRDRVSAFAAALKDPRLAARRIRIEGHTDSVGAAAKNQDLSERRAKAIADMLQAQGVDTARLDVKGYGSTKPLPGTSASNGVNRRVVAVLENQVAARGGDAMVDAAVDRGSALRPVYTLAAALGASILLIPLAQHGFAALGGALAMSAPLQDSLFVLVLFGALLAVALTGLRLDRRLHGLAGPKPLAMAAAGAGVGLVGLGAAAGFAALAGLAHPGGGAGAGAFALILGTVAILFQAGVEEIYFRGWLQPALAKAWGDVAGLLVAAAAFAALHIAGGARSPLTLVNLFLGGILFGLLAIRSRGLAAPIAAHFAWNWAEQILLGLDPNPGLGSFGAIVDLDLVGSSWWGGSDEGLNASLALCFALIALIVPLAAWRARD